MNRNDYLRTFIAILLPYEVTHFLTLMQNDLKKARIRASFPKPETMHLTLKFIGDTASGQIREIQECMMAVSLQDTAPLVLRAGGLGVFPSVKHTKVIWCGTQGRTDILEQIADALNNALHHRIGLKTENRRFSPHFTLARVKQPIPPGKMVDLIRTLSDRSSVEFQVSQLILMKSRLTPHGAIHTPLFSRSI